MRTLGTLRSSEKLKAVTCFVAQLHGFLGFLEDEAKHGKTICSKAFPILQAVGNLWNRTQNLKSSSRFWPPGLSNAR